MAINIGNLKTKVYLGSKNLNVYLGTKKIYPCGNIVTYHVDREKIYQEEVGEGESCLQPKHFTPSKSGWVFAGWRQDTTANGSVLNNLTMEDTPVTLYAVFKQTVTISFDGNENTGGNTSQQNEYIYYNNGNLEEAAFLLSTNGFTKTGHIFVCWAYDSPSGTTYPEGKRITLSNNTTFYAIWEADLPSTLIVFQKDKDDPEGNPTINNSYYVTFNGDMAQGQYKNPGYIYAVSSINHEIWNDFTPIDTRDGSCTINLGSYNKAIIEIGYWEHNCYWHDRRAEGSVSGLINGSFKTSSEDDHSKKEETGIFIGTVGSATVNSSGTIHASCKSIIEGDNDGDYTLCGGGIYIIKITLSM